MSTWEAALWGLLGGSVAEALALYALMLPQGAGKPWRWPWSRKADRPVMALALSLRLLASLGLATPFSASGQLPTPLSAFIAGAAAPLIVSRIFQSIPVSGALDTTALGASTVVARSSLATTSSLARAGPASSLQDDGSKVDTEEDDARRR